MAVELARTTALGFLGSAALFGGLGGGLLVRRAQGGVLPAALWGGGVMMLGALLLGVVGLWRAPLRGSSAVEPAGSAVASGASQRRLQLLPYCLAGGFLGTAVASGVVAVLRLSGLRTEERVLGGLLWGFGCGIAALAVVLRLRSFFAPLAQALPGRGPARPLLSVRSKLLGGFGWLLLCVTALALLKQILLGQLGGRTDGGLAVRSDAQALRGLFVVLPVQVAAAGGVVAMAVVGLAWPVRDLLRRAAAVVGPAEYSGYGGYGGQGGRGGRGELQRPIVLGVSAPAEVLELQRLFEQLRRLLLARLRSSTEQNLQLEAEVARRSAELSRRNQELSDALVRLQSAREELLRAEKLATVGRIAAGITSEIDAPVARMTDFCGQLHKTSQELLHSLPTDRGPAQPEQQQRLITQALAALAALTDNARRVRDIVRAMRVYVRPGETQAGRCDVQDVLDDVRQLFGEPFRHAIRVLRDAPEGARASQVVTVRSDLALLLTSWLGRVEPRLRDRPDAQVVVRTRLLELPATDDPDDPSRIKVCEITLVDNGRPLTASEQVEPLGPELLRRLGAQAWVRKGPRPDNHRGDADAASAVAPTPSAAVATVPTVPTLPDEGVDASWETVLTVRLPIGAPLLPLAG